jgi:hypothetical protein
MVSDLRNSRESRKPRDGHSYLDGMYSYDFSTEIPLIIIRVSFLDGFNDAASENRVKVGLETLKFEKYALQCLGNNPWTEKSFILAKCPA